MPSPSSKTSTSPPKPVSPSNIHVTLLGRGAGGAVYRVQFGSAKPFAVKLGTNEDASERLEYEDNIVRSLQKAPVECRKFFLAPAPRPRDPKTRSNMIKKIFEDLDRRRIGHEDSQRTMFMYMEYLEHAVSLAHIDLAIKQVKANKPIPPELAFFLQPPVLKSILDQIPKAFLCLFKEGLLHYDAHMQNIMIVRNVSNAANEPVSVKLIDFGLSQDVNPLPRNTTLKNMDRIRKWYHASKPLYSNVSWPNLTWVNGEYVNNRNVNAGFMQANPNIQKNMMKKAYNSIKNFAATSPSKSPKAHRLWNARSQNSRI
jgi:hypothetical protein